VPLRILFRALVEIDQLFSSQEPSSAKKQKSERENQDKKPADTTTHSILGISLPRNGLAWDRLRHMI
jgi:hypothetical protein